MALKQTYSCDKCGHEQPNANQMWDIGIGVDASDGPYRITSALRIKAMWCRKCVEDARLLPVPSHEPQRELPPQPTLEDLIREIAGQVIHMWRKNTWLKSTKHKTPF